jgi:hypothetical protein
MTVDSRRLSNPLPLAGARIWLSGAVPETEGLTGWLWKKRILDLLMNVQQESSLTLARQLVTEPRFLRVNVTTAQGSYRLDGPKEIGELADLGYNVARQPEIISQIKSRFLNGISAAPWQRYEPGAARGTPV